MEFDPVSWAHQELIPIAKALVELVESEGEKEQGRFFAAVLHGLEAASTGVDLADPLMLLSMSAFRGFSFSAGAALLLDRLLEGSQQLSELLSLDDSELH
ncbi:MAG: hypothetical protein JRF61_07130 [Deltaproteobacteria bacterium]|nr:hypothetical protein [Deltaproteobacteria bacterium]